MRLIHTADLHLDTSYAASGMPAGFGNRRRQSLREVLRSIVRRAGEWPADALLIAGDLFDLDRVTRDTVAFLQTEFASISHVPVFISPGNHDPYVPGSPYQCAPWPENVAIFPEPRWRAHAFEERAFTVHGFGFDGPDVSANPFGLLNPVTNGHVHVAVAHGSELTHQPPDKDSYAPFVAADAASPALSYLALGHLHSVTHVKGDFTTRIAYSGAPEGHGYDETGPRHFLEVEITPGNVAIRPVRSSRSIYMTHSVDCSAFTTSQQVIDAIRALPKQDGAALIARITLTGTCAAELRNETESIVDAVADGFEHVDLLDQTVPSEDFDTLASEPTSLGGFVSRMNDELRDAMDPQHRELLLRARALGVSAYKDAAINISGLERD